jgi:hypothetical protein
VDTRQQRMAKNEAIFREVNERIEAINARLGENERECDFLCECGDHDCTKPVRLTLAEYEAVRSHPARFAIVCGHEQIDVERVIEDHGRYAVVEKLPGAPAEIARERDPRS